MIVRRDGDGWTMIKQIDHAKHCADIAKAWRQGPYGPESVSKSLEYAAEYHDLGWTEPDCEPEVDTEGRPMNFTQADEARHTSFYSRAVRTIGESDPYAAYLVSLHASGLYSRRYGWMGLNPVDWTKIGPHGKALLARERAFRAEVVKSASPQNLEFEQAWRNYMLLETFDYLSLLTCYGFESTVCGPVPTFESQWEQFTIRRIGSWEVELSPFPFAGKSLKVAVPYVHLGPALFESDKALQQHFAAAHLEQRHTIYRAAGS